MTDDKVILSDSMTAECEAIRAADEATRKPYISVTYEMSGTWMMLGSLEEYGNDPTELGRVICELMREELANWPNQPDERDRLLVRISELTDSEAANLPEFPGW